MVMVVVLAILHNLVNLQLSYPTEFLYLYLTCPCPFLSLSLVSLVSPPICAPRSSHPWWSCGAAGSGTRADTGPGYSDMTLDGFLLLLFQCSFLLLPFMPGGWFLGEILPDSNSSSIVELP
ncbi:hypothetical protein V8C43DRAFT_276325 [Trichoderma afarasin]